MTEPTIRYRHRTAEVEAVQWTGSNADALRAFCGPDFDEIELDDRTEDPDESAAVREGKHGTWRGLRPGDWVAKMDGGLYEFAAADFAEHYELAVPAPATDQAAELRGVASYLHQRGTDLDDGGLTAAADLLVRQADAVLSVLPATVDRAAVYAEVADRLAADAEQGAKEGFTRIYRRSAAKQVREWGEELRRMADETQQPEARDDQGGALIEDYLRFLRGQGPEPDLSELPPEHRDAIAGQFEIVRALADRDPLLPPLDRDPVARRLGLFPPAPAQQPKEARP